MSGEVKIHTSVAGKYYTMVPRYMMVRRVGVDSLEQCRSEKCKNFADYNVEWYDENDNAVDVDNECSFCYKCLQSSLAKYKLQQTTVEMNAKRPIMF